MQYILELIYYNTCSYDLHKQILYICYLWKCTKFVI